MGKEFCPICDRETLDLTRYRAMLVVAPDKALFSMVCPACGGHSASLYRIPVSLMQMVRTEAAKLGAGMGKGV